MQTPNSHTPVSRLVAAGRFLVAALVQLTDTADLAAVLQPMLDALVAAIAATAAADDATILPRVAVRFAERNVETAIRGLALAAQALDEGKAGGRVLHALFPSGVGPVVLPQAETQRAVATQLLNRLGAQELAAPLRAVHEPALRTAIDALSHALDVRDAAGAAYDETFNSELGAREAFVRSYDVIASTIRARFPKDRAKQDLFFDTLRATSAPADEGGVTQPHPAATPAPHP